MTAFRESPGQVPHTSANDEGNRLALFEQLVLDGVDLRMVVETCTRAEYSVYDSMLKLCMRQPAHEFLAHGYLVANAAFLPRKKHGRLKAHIASLVSKNVIVALNPPKSRHQYYLLGCEWKGAPYFMSWITYCLAWRPPATVLGPNQVSKGGQRPTSAETPISLQYKGFVPSAPLTLSLNRSNVIERAQNPTERDQRPPRTISAGARKAQDPTVRQQRQLLANEISQLAGIPPIATGKLGGILDVLIKTYGFEQCLLLIQEAWSKRDSLLTNAYPTFTAQSVHFYATFRRKSNLPKQQSTSITLRVLITDAMNGEGTCDYDRLHRQLALYGLRRSPVDDAVCAEFGLNPGRVFPPS